MPQQELPRINKASLLNKLDVQALDSNGTHTVDHGTLAVVNNTIDATTGTVKLKANFDNPQLQLWPGIFVNVRLLVETLQNGRDDPCRRGCNEARKARSCSPSSTTKPSCRPSRRASRMIPKP